MAWIAALVGVAGSALMNSGGGSSGTSGQVPYYQPGGLGATDTGWQQMFGGAKDLATQGAAAANPLYQQTLQQQQAINYAPYTQAAQRAGGQYDWLSNLAGAQGQAYGQQAGLAGQQQQNLYGAANQIYQTAFDPQNAQFAKTQQQLQDQVRAGQAARGLGNSPVGGAEENQAMQNLDLAWRQQQLANQATGLQAMSGASSAGGAQGQLTGANLAAQLAAYGQMPGFTQQAASTPITAQQYVAGQPAAAGQQYAQNLGGLQSLYGMPMQQAIPYMNFGQGATQAQNLLAQQNYQNQAQQNAANANLFSQLGGAAVQSYNTPGSWLNNVFGGSSGGGSTGGGFVDTSGSYGGSGWGGNYLSGSSASGF